MIVRCSRSSTETRAGAIASRPQLGRLRATAVGHGEPLETSLGVALSCYPLPDGRLDWVLSASHPSWSAETTRRLAADLWPGGEVVLGRTPDVIHVISMTRSTGSLTSLTRRCTMP